MNLSEIKSKNDVLKYFLENWKIDSLIAIKEIVDNIDDIYTLLINYDQLLEKVKIIKSFNNGDYSGNNYTIRYYSNKNRIAVNVKRYNDYIDDKEIREAIDFDLPDDLKDEFIEWLENSEDIWPQFIDVIREDLLNILKNPKEYWNNNDLYFDAINNLSIYNNVFGFYGRSGGWFCLPLFMFDTTDFDNFDIVIQNKNINELLDEIENGEYISTIIDDINDIINSIDLIDQWAEFIKKYNMGQNFTDYIINNIDYYIETFEKNYDPEETELYYA